MQKTPPLQGVRVLEIGNLVATPSAARILAEFGADVIKVEAPGGDPLRKWGELSPSGSSWWWYSQNRNKRFISIDLKEEKGRQIVKDLAQECDILIENLRPGRLASWGLGYDNLRQIHPGIIYVSISGYGLTGPYKDRPGFGNVAEAMGGLRYTTGYSDRPPVRTGTSIGDEIAAFQAVIGALMALHRRHQDENHLGDHVDVALTESVLSITEGMVSEYLHTGVVQERTGNQLLRAAPSNIYQTQDCRWIAIGANSQPIFYRLLKLMGREELAQDPRFSTNPGRVANADELDAMMSEWTAQYTLENLMKKLTDSDIPAGPVMNAQDIASDGHYQSREMIVSVPSEDVGSVQMLGVVPRLKNHPGGIHHTGASIGRHSGEILSQLLGLQDEEIEALKTQGIVV